MVKTSAINMQSTTMQESVVILEHSQSFDNLSGDKSLPVWQTGTQSRSCSGRLGAVWWPKREKKTNNNNN